jgi:hypothetical protein
MDRQPCPLDEMGLPFVPEEFMDFPGPEDTHHLYWPKQLYLGHSAVTAVFRTLHKVEMPRLGHNLYHASFDPPAMPSPEFMRGFILASDVHLPTKVRKELRR